MASLIPGYEYDIFISYRQKDNKHDGWVTKFVENLKGELESTFKEDISIYFDENPHDRLQETYNVSKSLEGKLKCLIFIPILSQTYCDPASYAWQYEFLTFIKLTEDDRFGKEIKLKSGNVASRILPIRIHDLAPEDIKLFEKETGGVLRAMDFVFKTATGVNRPLKLNEDHPQDNLNKSFYDDQINKVAHAIKDIIHGMKAEDDQKSLEEDKILESIQGVKEDKKIIVSEGAGKSNRIKLISVLGIVAILVIALLIAYPKIFRRDKFKELRDTRGKISIAVLPFENLSGDTTLNWFQKGISSLIINGLGNSQELAVCDDPTLSEALDGMERVSTAGMLPSQAREVARKLKAESYISGSFQGREDKYWIMVNLVNTETGNIIWTNKVEGNIKSSAYLELADSLCGEIKNYLEIKALENNASFEFREAYPQSAEAYRFFIDGMNLVLSQNYETGIKSLKKSLAIDSVFALANFYLTYACWYNLQYDEGLSSLKKTYSLKDRIPLKYQLWVEMWYSCLLGNNMDEVIRYCDLLAESGINTRLFWSDLGVTYHDFPWQNEKAVSAFEKVMEINRERGSDWKFEVFYDRYGDAFHKIGRHKEEQELYDIGLSVLPDNSTIIARRIICLLSQGDTISANPYLVQQINKVKKLGYSESDIERNLGHLFAEAGIFAKAESHFRKAYRLDPKYLGKIWSLAWFLIDFDINVDEGLELVETTLDSLPNNRRFLLLKGIGKYKQGRYDEAVDILGKEWSNGIGSYTNLYHYYPEAKQALANQKKN